MDTLTCRLPTFVSFFERHDEPNIKIMKKNDQDYYLIIQIFLITTKRAGGGYVCTYIRFEYVVELS